MKVLALNRDISRLSPRFLTVQTAPVRVVLASDTLRRDSVFSMEAVCCEVGAVKSRFNSKKWLESHTASINPPHTPQVDCNDIYIY